MERRPVGQASVPARARGSTLMRAHGATPVAAGLRARRGRGGSQTGRDARPTVSDEGETARRAVPPRNSVFGSARTGGHGGLPHRRLRVLRTRLRVGRGDGFGGAVRLGKGGVVRLGWQGRAGTEACPTGFVAFGMRGLRMRLRVGTLGATGIVSSGSWRARHSIVIDPEPESTRIVTVKAPLVSAMTALLSA